MRSEYTDEWLNTVAVGDNHENFLAVLGALTTQLLDEVFVYDVAEPSLIPIFDFGLGLFVWHDARVCELINDQVSRLGTHVLLKELLPVKFMQRTVAERALSTSLLPGRGAVLDHDA